MRVILTIMACVVTFNIASFVLTRLFFAAPPSSAGGIYARAAALIVQLLLAIAVASLTWRRMGSASAERPGLLRNMILGGLIVGGISFAAGFCGPLIFAPDANQGPLLGIFITGPLGFLLGMAGGAIHWRRRQPRSGEHDARST